MHKAVTQNSWEDIVVFRFIALMSQTRVSVELDKSPKTVQIENVPSNELQYMGSISVNNAHECLVERVV